MLFDILRHLDTASRKFTTYFNILESDGGYVDVIEFQSFNVCICMYMYIFPSYAELFCYKYPNSPLINITLEHKDSRKNNI